MTKQFEEASRLKLRYKSKVGLITTEDLWDLPLQSKINTSLDGIAISIYEDIEATGKKSFVTKNKTDDILELKLDIVRYIIEVKIEQAKDAKAAIENRERKELLMDVIAETEIDELKGKSVKDLKKEIKSL